MKLVKSCRAEHNVRNGSRIQLGTLDYYRRILNEELRDEGEATHEIALNIQGHYQMPLPIFNTLNGGVFTIGPFDPRGHVGFPYVERAHFESLKIITTSRTHVDLDSPKVVIQRRHPEGWIFCMSTAEQAGEKIFNGYDDYWAIPLDKAKNFAAALAAAFKKQFRQEENYTKWVSPAFEKDLKSSRWLDSWFHVQHMPVLYGDREIVIRDNDPAAIEKALNQVANIAFTKPSRFSSEREYRFLLSVYGRTDKMPPDAYNTYTPACDTILLEVNFDDCELT